MKYRTLGGHGLLVSEIGFGAWGIGGRTAGTTSYGDTDDRASLAALGRALDSGITFVDTSSAHGNGHSEELIGQAFQHKRARVVIATKAGYDAWDRGPDFSPAAIVASVGAEPRRGCGSDYIDLLPASQRAARCGADSGDLREALAGLETASKIRAWGVSAKSPAEAIAAVSELDAPVVQANFNMMDVRAAEKWPAGRSATPQGGPDRPHSPLFRVPVGHDQPRTPSSRRETIGTGWSTRSSWRTGSTRASGAAGGDRGRSGHQRRAKRAALLLGFSSDLHRDPGDSDADGGRGQRSSKRSGALAGAGRARRAGDQSPAAVLREADGAWP